MGFLNIAPCFLQKLNSERRAVKASQLFENFSEHWLEAGAFGLGLVAATLVVRDSVVLAGVVVALVAMHRGVLLAQFRRAARTDAKTGLYSPE